MKNIYLTLLAVTISFTASSQFGMSLVSSYSTGIFDEGAAEIIAYDPNSHRIFHSNADDNSVGILDFSDPTNITSLGSIDMSSYGDGVNSVAVMNGVVAVAVEGDGDADPGYIVFFDTLGTYIVDVEVGVLPDMVTFTPDGNYLVVACEAEPDDDYTIDAKGSITIIDISGGISNLTQGDVNDMNFDNVTIPAGVRIFGPEEGELEYNDLEDTTFQLGNWWAQSDLSDEDWRYDDFGGDHFIEINGWGADTNSIDWLISRTFDLRDFEAVYFEFENAKNFSGGSLDLLVTTQTAWDPATANFDTLTSQVAWSTGGYQDTMSGAIDLSAYIGEQFVRLVFLYQSGNSTGTATVWQLDELEVWGAWDDANNIEPEYVAVNANSQEAYVICQENNAIAKVNISGGSITSLMPLGYKDHSVAGNGLDASNRDDTINITTYPFRGLYQPDAAKSYTVNSTAYIVTANEGDSRDYDAYSEEERLEDLTLDATAFPNASKLQLAENGGRIKVTTSMGDTDGDGDYDEIYTYGARSFSIWDASGNLVFDSGDEFEQVIATDDPDHFNSTNDDNDSFDNRSDDKGPEPEAVEIAEIGGSFYAFIGLERHGGIMAYDITDPSAPTFLDFVNNRNWSVAADAAGAGDLGPEDIKFVSDTDSPDGKFYILTANEVSGTVSAFELTGLSIGNEEIDEEVWTLHPNPTAGMLSSSEVSDFRVLDLQGRLILEVKNSDQIDLSSLTSGTYFVLNAEGEAEKVIKN
jgi:hypothetical protein